MLDEHYAGLINIADYWAVGDSRIEAISEIPSGTTGETQSAQEVEFIIIGIGHDDKDDGSGKTAITVQTRNSLENGGYMYNNHDGGSSLWSGSPRRTWCNNDFKSALPSHLQILIKSVSKVSNRHAQSKYPSYRGQTNTTDDVFLLSEFETFGGAPYSGDSFGDVGSDGTQYEYMKTQENRVKTGPANQWYLRSSLVSNANASFIEVYSNGAASDIYAENTIGIAPAFCL